MPDKKAANRFIWNAEDIEVEEDSFDTTMVDKKQTNEKTVEKARIRKVLRGE